MQSSARQLAPKPTQAVDQRSSLMSQVRPPRHARQRHLARCPRLHIHQISGGVKLKKASDRKLAERKPQPSGHVDVASILASTIRGAVAYSDSDSDDDSDDNSDWDDSDDDEW